MALHTSEPPQEVLTSSNRQTVATEISARTSEHVETHLLLSKQPNQRDIVTRVSACFNYGDGSGSSCIGYYVQMFDKVCAATVVQRSIDRRHGLLMYVAGNWLNSWQT